MYFERRSYRQRTVTHAEPRSIIDDKGLVPRCFVYRLNYNMRFFLLKTGSTGKINIKVTIRIFAGDHIEHPKESAEKQRCNG